MHDDGFGPAVRVRRTHMSRLPHFVGPHAVRALCIQARVLALGAPEGGLDEPMAS